jgi:tRNA G18 (ribose-2'-O)-methylase SpoU
MFGMPLALHESTLDAVELAQKSGISVVSTSAKATLSYHEVDYTQPTLILVGNEHHGVNEEAVERSDHCVSIPMLGHIHSLNIAVAASLMLFEAQRQRGFKDAHTSTRSNL